MSAYQDAKRRFTEDNHRDDLMYVVVASRAKDGDPETSDLVGKLWDASAGAWVTPEDPNDLPGRLLYSGVPRLMHRYSDGRSQWSWRPHHSADKASMAAMSNPTGLWVSVCTVNNWREEYLPRAVQRVAEVAA